MAQPLFISEQWLKDNSVVDENVDPQLLRPAIVEAMDIAIHPILGTTLYDKLKADVTGATLAGDYLTLMDTFIAPALKYFTMVELTPEMLVKYMNKAVVEKSSENSNPIDFKKMSWMMKRWADKAEYYAERLKGHLCENSELFPEYENPEFGKDKLKPQKGSSFTEGMFLGVSNYGEREDDFDRSAIDDPTTST